MNFTEFSFWWFLLVVGFPLFSIRFFSKRVELWPAQADSYLLALLSLSLFWNAAHHSFFIFVIELLINYLAVNAIFRLPRQQAKYLAVSIVLLDLAILAYYKYINFFLTGILLPISSSFNSPDFFGLLSSSPGDLQGGRIPPGISFYTFQMIGFVVDSFRNRSNKNVRFIDYINFASFFPQVVAGPIERREDFLPQIRSFQFQFNGKNFESGMQWLVLGLFMKLVLADNISAYVLLDESSNSWLIWLSIISFGFRIYFDFAGYSLIALGIAKIIGIELTLNFRSPYISQNVQEFWRRWHVTLSSWFRDYLYIPIGGSRVPWAPLNLLIVFTISGLWHGAGWNFIWWGSYHGFLLMGHRALKNIVPLPSSIKWLLTTFSVFVGWLFFMDPDFGRILTKLTVILTPSSYSLEFARKAWRTFPDIEKGSLLLTLGLIITVLILEYVSESGDKPSPYRLLRFKWITPLLIGGTILLTAQNSAEFIYFAF